MPPLETRDYPDVELLAPGLIFGKGSPPEGDNVTIEDIRAYVATHAELAGVVKSKLKLGHDPAQPLLRNSGLVDEAGAPAAGWFENFREANGKLIADLKRVPAKLGQLVESGAFGRTRSVEIRSYTDAAGKRHKIIDAVALLGGRSPAVRNLDDIVALYEAGPNVTLGGDPGDDVQVLDYHVTGDDTRLAPIQGSNMPDLKITPENAAKIAASLGIPEADVSKLTPERMLEAAEALAAKVPEGDAAAALTAATTERDALKVEVETLKKNAGTDEATRALEARLEAAEKSAAASATALANATRDRLIDTAIRERRLKPADRDQTAKDYDAAPDVMTRVLERLPVDAELVRIYGADGDGDGGPEPVEPDEKLAEEDRLYADYCGAVGVADPTPDRKVPA